MIRIGLTQREKQKELDKYLASHDIKKIFCFYYRDFPIQFKTDVPIEYIEYADIEMYKFFYRLLEEIDNSSLIIMDECMRTQNRSELIYNCAHHYLNQTEHRIIFEFFPIIEDSSDFMILLDFENKSKYKDKGFDYSYLYAEDIKMKPYKFKIQPINVEISDKDKERYEEYKEQLFDNLGQKDPDTIPRNLQLFVGNLKKPFIEIDKLYVARNKRFKLDNVKTYKEVTGPGEYIVLDTHYQRLRFNDFLKTTRMKTIYYMSTLLPIDNYILTELTKWKARLDAFYAQASLYK